MKFYKNISFKQTPFVSQFTNPNKMYLSTEAKGPISRMYGDL